MTYTFTFHVERDNGPFNQPEFECVVTYNVSKSYAATYMQPAEGGEVEILSVTHNGVEFYLTNAEEERLQTEAEEVASRHFADERANDEAEYRADMRRDDRMMDSWGGVT